LCTRSGTNNSSYVKQEPTSPHRANLVNIERLPFNHSIIRGRTRSIISVQAGNIAARWKGPQVRTELCVGWKVAVKHESVVGDPAVVATFMPGTLVTVVQSRQQTRRCTWRWCSPAYKQGDAHWLCVRCQTHRQWQGRKSQEGLELCSRDETSGLDVINDLAPHSQTREQQQAGQVTQPGKESEAATLPIFTFSWYLLPLLLLTLAARRLPTQPWHLVFNSITYVWEKST
jgi:hypothetical protein